MRGRTLWVTGLLAALLVAGVVSLWASAQPDGLEHVAGSSGFLDAADDSLASDSPLADYETAGVEDDRLSGGLAGIIGSLVVLLLATGLFRLLRRRPAGQHPAPVDRA